MFVGVDVGYASTSTVFLVRARAGVIEVLKVVER